METQLLEIMFGRMGARLKIRDAVSRRQPAGIDIRSDRRGEYFDIGVEPGDRVEYEVLDIRPRFRHLPLMARRVDEHRESGGRRKGGCVSRLTD